MRPLGEGFPRFYAAASLKREQIEENVAVMLGFPRFYAAASLKRRRRAHRHSRPMRFSAVLCRGLIEACRTRRRGSSRHGRVFRGFMPRPH